MVAVQWSLVYRRTVAFLYISPDSVHFLAAACPPTAVPHIGQEFKICSKNLYIIQNVIEKV